MAKKTAIASDRISIGHVSLTVRYAALAPAEAKKKITTQTNVCDAASKEPLSNRNALTPSKTPDSRYVPEIILRRPTESNNGPSKSGPARLPTENASPYTGTAVALTP